MNSKNHSHAKPLSPHIQIYKPQISSFTSIFHRATGIFLYIGVVLICWAIVHYAYQVEILADGEIEEKTCDCSWKYLVYVAVLMWSFSLYYHMCNGIRHLFWDIGKGFEKKTANRNGILVLITSAMLTIASASYVLLFV